MFQQREKQSAESWYRSGQSYDHQPGQLAGSFLFINLFIQLQIFCSDSNLMIFCGFHLLDLFRIFFPNEPVCLPLFKTVFFFFLKNK